MGQIGDLEGHYLLEHSHVHKWSTQVSDHHHRLLENDARVSWFEQQRQLKRVKRSSVANRNSFR